MPLNDGMMSSKTSEWATPQDFFDKLDSEFHFTLDVCATPENAKCHDFFTKDDDGLSKEWYGIVWMNPPYGREISKWVEKCANYEGASVMLLPARTDTRWFHDYIYNNPRAEVRFVKGRLRFNGSNRDAPFPSMVVVLKPKL